MSNLGNLIRYENEKYMEPCITITMNDDGVMEANLFLKRYKDKPKITLHPSGTDARTSNRKERSIPHFHIVNKDGKPLPVAIRLCEADYFVHDIYKKRISEVKELRSEYYEILDDTLRERCKYYNGTNWEYLVHLWNETAKSFKGVVVVPDYITQPDYTELP